MHKSLSNLPIIIIIEWMICALFLTKIKFYLDNFETIDNIDTIAVSISLMHFVFFNKYYSNSKNIFVVSIILGIILRLLYSVINSEVYFYLYFANILMPFIANSWMKQNAKK